jgi:hypothetical protein
MVEVRVVEDLEHVRTEAVDVEVDPEVEATWDRAAPSWVRE